MLTRTRERKHQRCCSRSFIATFHDYHDYNDKTGIFVSLTGNEQNLQRKVIHCQTESPKVKMLIKTLPQWWLQQSAVEQRSLGDTFLCRLNPVSHHLQQERWDIPSLLWCSCVNAKVSSYAHIHYFWHVDGAFCMNGGFSHPIQFLAKHPLRDTDRKSRF